MYKLFYIDIETYFENKKGENEIIPYCICIIDENNYKHSFYDTEILNFASFISNLDSENIFYAHNLSYDGWFIINLMTKHLDNDWKIKTIENGSTIYMIKLKKRKQNKTIIFKCSNLLLGASLENLANTYNIENKKGVFPYNFINKNTLYYEGEKPESKYYNSISDWKKEKKYIKIKENCINYCFNDINILIKCIKIFKEIINRNFEINIDEIYSLPGLALKIFFKKFNEQKIKFNEIEEKDIDIYNSYYGGRCEYFGNPFNKNSKVLYFDHTQMYPNIMKEDFPFIDKYTQKKTKFSPNHQISKWGFYKITFQSNLDIPILPIKKEKLMFNNGVHTGWYYSEEINLAISYGVKIIKIHEAYIFDKSHKPFLNFTTELMKMREKAKNIDKNLIESDIFKKICNSLYGKFAFGFIDENYSFIYINEIEKKLYIDILNKKIKKVKSYQNIWEKNEIEQKIEELNKSKITHNINKFVKFPIYNKHKSNIGYASIITARGRIKIYKNIQDVNKSGRVLYTDTDCIFAEFKNDIINNSNFYDNFKKKGVDWQKEGINHIKKEFMCFGAKTYAYINNDNSEKIVVKGVNNNKLKSSINFKQIKNYFLSKDYKNENKIIKIKQYSPIVKNNKVYGYNINKSVTFNPESKRQWKNNYETYPYNR